MSLLMLLAALAVVGVLAAVVTGRLDASMPAATPSSPHRPLPEGDLGPADVDAVRFSLAVRGYRMDEVDAVLARLRAELARRDGQAVRAAGDDSAQGADPVGASVTAAVPTVTVAVPAAAVPAVEDAAGAGTSADAAERRHGRRSRSTAQER